jgi:hypothetical protein
MIGKYERIDEYEMTVEHEVTSWMYDTSYYLYESHLPFIDSKTHHPY